MIKASALYIVIIIALVIALICSSVIIAAYFYKIQNQKKFRYDNLSLNLSSGMNLLLAGADTSYLVRRSFSLFGGDADSVSIQRLTWGAYQIGIAKAFIQKDTLFKVFSIANPVDSSKWAALYLIDENRPFSLSGHTSIQGNVFIPKAGVQTAYVNNYAYQGDKRLIIGTRRTSEKELPELDAKWLERLSATDNNDQKRDSSLENKDTISVSFLNPTMSISLQKDNPVIKNKLISGNIILYADTALVIDSTTVLKNILVFAKSIEVKSGFHGNCQLFAVDSISIGRNCRFDYPSCLGIIRFDEKLKINTQAKITIGDQTTFSGVVFTYQKAKNDLMPLIVIGKHTTLKGQVYSQGTLELKDSCEVDGSTFTSRFSYRNSTTVFENYLINATLDSRKLSPYYLSSGLLPASGKRKKTLQWLEVN